jgi:hypothetical protein
MKKKINLKKPFYLANIILLISIFNIIDTTRYAQSKMYLWKDENGVFNASEEIPGWWPPKTNCIAWVPGKENKVADFVKTTQKSALCLLPDNTKEKVKKQAQKETKEEQIVEKEIPEPTDKEIRIYCTYQKSLLQFLDRQNTEEAAAEYISKKFEISKEDLLEIHSKVVDYKGGDYKCTY